MGSDWEEVPFNELGEVGRGKSKHRPRYAEHLYGGKYPFIQTGDIRGSNGRITEHSQTYSEAGLAQSKLWPKGTMCITIAANIAETAILTYPACFPDSVVGFIANEDRCDVRFVEYSFRLLKRRLQAEAIGSVQDNINLATLSRLNIELPPIAEQKAMAHILGSLDDKIELNRQMNQTLESMAQALFKSWFVDFDPVIDNALAAGNPIPDALKAKAAQRADQLKAATQSGTPPAENRGLFPSEFAFTEELGWIPMGWTVGAVKEVVKRLKINKTYTKKDVLDHGAVPVYEQGAKILLGYHNNEPNIKASINNPAFIFGDHTCINKLSLEPFSTSSNVITLIGKIYPTVWVYYAVKDKQSFEEYRRHWMEFIIKPVILPSLELTELFSEYTTSFQVKQMKIQNQNSDLAKLRDTLLPKLLSGELRIADAAALVEGV